MRRLVSVSNKVIEIQAGDEKEELTAETIIINTGVVPTILPIPGLAESKFAGFNRYSTFGKPT